VATSPLVRCSEIWFASILVALSEGAFMAGFPSPAAPWQPAQRLLKSAAPSSAASPTVLVNIEQAPIIKTVPNRLKDCFIVFSSSTRIAEFGFRRMLFRGDLIHCFASGPKKVNPNSCRIVVRSWLSDTTSLKASGGPMMHAAAS